MKVLFADLDAIGLKANNSCYEHTAFYTV